MVGAVHGGDDVEEAVLLETCCRVGVAGGVMEPGSRLEGDAGTHAVVYRRGEFVLVGVRGFRESARAEFCVNAATCQRR